MIWTPLACCLVALSGVLSTPMSQAQTPDAAFHPAIPRTWNDSEMAALELPLADAVASPKHVNSDYYYKIPVRPIYRQYPVYAPGSGPPGYIEWLRRQEPEIIWGEDKNGRQHTPPLQTRADWLRAGEIVFDSVLGSLPFSDKELAGMGEYIAKRGIPLAHDGSIAIFDFRILEKGKIEMGTGSCKSCHARLMPDGTISKGAQSNFPFDRIFAEDVRAGLRGSLPAVQFLERALFAQPWRRPDSIDSLLGSVEKVASVHEAIPPGVIARHRSSPFYPVQVPDLIGVKDRKYLDHTGLQLHRSIADLMRYAALNQGADSLASFNGFIPLGGPNFDVLPEPANQPVQRYSDEQLYALSMWLYSLKPPANPDPGPQTLVGKGQKVFERESCGGCHTPPLYTNNKLTPAKGFEVPDIHKSRYDILPVVVGTDPHLAMKTRRGTGYYKVPSLRGLWYRGPFEHSGSVATLEDWFDARRLRDDYVPTGFKGYDVKTRAVPGHEFGLKLNAADKRALIAFLRRL